MQLDGDDAALPLDSDCDPPGLSVHEQRSTLLPTLPCELWELILQWTPAISEHVRLAAVCHSWRDALTHRMALSALATQDYDKHPDCTSLLAVLANCTKLVTLAIPKHLLSNDFVDALGALECAHTLRSLGVLPTHRKEVSTLLPPQTPGRSSLGRVLAALPLLDTLSAGNFDFVVDDGDILTRLLSRGMHVLSLWCPGPVLPPRALWAGELSALHRLCVGLPADRSLHHKMMGDLRELVPWLEALDLGIPEVDPYELLNESDLFALLDGASSALRELSIMGAWRDSDTNIHMLDRCAISEAFAPFVERSLAGLVKVTLGLHGDRGAACSAIECVLKLPQLRIADIWGAFNEQPCGPLRLCTSPRLECLRLELPCAVKIKMPALQSLYLRAPAGTLDCPALEELVCVAHSFWGEPLPIICSGSTTTRVRTLAVRFAVVKAMDRAPLTFTALESLTMRGISVCALVASAPRLKHLCVDSSILMEKVEALMAVAPALRTVELTCWRKDVLTPQQLRSAWLACSCGVAACSTAPISHPPLLCSKP